MPRYAYHCSACGANFLTAHSPEEVLKKCIKCSASKALTKLLTKPSYTVEKKNEQKVGEFTEDFIKESRKELKRQRKELDKQR